MTFISNLSFYCHILIIWNKASFTLGFACRKLYVFYIMLRINLILKHCSLEKRFNKFLTIKLVNHITLCLEDRRIIADIYNLINDKIDWSKLLGILSFHVQKIGLKSQLVFMILFHWTNYGNAVPFVRMMQHINISNYDYYLYYDNLNLLIINGLSYIVTYITFYFLFLFLI